MITSIATVTLAISFGLIFVSLISLIVAAFASAQPLRIRARVFGLFSLSATFALMALGLLLIDVQAGKVTLDLLFAAASGWFSYSNFRQAMSEKQRFLDGPKDGK